MTLKFDSYNIDPQSLFLHCQYFLITSLAASLSRKYDAKNGYSDLLAREQSGSVFQLGIAFSATGQSLDFTAPVFFDHSTSKKKTNLQLNPLHLTWVSIFSIHSLYISYGADKENLLTYHELL